MKQTAPFPEILADLVSRTRFGPGYEVTLEDLDRGQGSAGLTLVVLTHEQDTYHPESLRPVNHYFIVPAASYNRRSWQRWLFEQLSAVSRHEDAEWFRLRQDADEPGAEDYYSRPYAPLHGPGNDPYLIAELTTGEERRTSFRGTLNPGTP
jgi:hypothetical protein